MKNEPILEIAIKASVSAGKFLMKNYNKKIKSSITKESLRDVATEIDKMSEKVIIDILYDFNKDISIFTEEHGKINDKSNFPILHFIRTCNS